MNRQIFVVAGLLIGASGLFGQTQMRYEFGGNAFQFGLGAADGRVFGVEPLTSQVVTGKPFSGVEERRSLQTLGDGTKIENSETNRLFRDDQGRTRIERSGGNITIFDPVAGFSAELDPKGETVSKVNVTIREGSVVGRSAIVSYTTGDSSATLVTRLDRLREELALKERAFTPQNPAVRSLQAQITELEKAIAALSRHPVLSPSASIAGGVGNARTFLFQPTGESIALASADGPVVMRVAQGENASVESLPTQSINGAMAQGTRTTETIPVGKIGNDRPISVVNERWFSDDLKMLVKSSSADPRFGNTTYELKNIVQTAPDPALFLIPADYTIRK